MLEGLMAFGWEPILDRGNGRGRTVSMGVNVAF